jgi:tetratricopeptide (TPR) repeat protein
MPEWLDKLLKRKSPEEQANVLQEDLDLEAFFTDVEHLRQVFHDLVSAEALPKRLLVIHGVGGVGKSTLLRMFRLYCKRQGVPVALVSGDDAKSPVDVLCGFAKDLARDGIELTDLARTLRRYREIQAKVEREGAKIGGAAAKAGTRAVVEIGAGYIPVVGPVVAALGGAGAEAFVDWLRGFLPKSDLDLYLDPAARLTQDFLGDLAPTATRRRLVLMLDTYEQLAGVDEWVRDLAKKLPANALTVIAGREAPGKTWDRDWPGWLGHTHIEALEAMTEEHMRALVESYYRTIQGGNPDPVQVGEIVRFARGLPLVVTSAVRLWVCYGMQDFQTVKPRVVADLVDRLMEGTPEEMRPALEAAATLRWFNKELLRVLLPAQQIEPVYDELCRFPFVRSRAAGFALHDTVREMLDQNLAIQDPEWHAVLHEAAATHFEERAAGLIGDERDRSILEALYHRTRCSEEKGMSLLIGMAEQLVQQRLISRLRNLVNDWETFPLELPRSRKWREYYSARLAHLEGQLEDAEEVYRGITADEPLDTKLTAYAFSDLGQILMQYERLGQPGGVQEAILALERSMSIVQLDSHLVNGYFHLARVHRYTARWEEEASVLERAQQFFAERGDEYGLAATYVEMKRGQAKRGLWKDLFNSSAQLDSMAPRMEEWTYLRSKQLGEWVWAWASAGRLADGEQRARESLALVRPLGDPVSLLRTLRDFGWILGCQQRYDEASRSFSESLEIAEGLGLDYKVSAASVLGFWGAVLLRQGRFGEAHDHLSRSISIKEELNDHPGIFEVLTWLGLLCEVQSDPAAAKHWYDRSIEWKWTGRLYFLSESLVGLSRVQFEVGESDAGLATFAEAEQLARQYEYNDHLGSLRLAQGHAVWGGHLSDWSGGFDVALVQYQQAMTYALRYNRFMLDEVLWGGGICTPLDPIIPHCQERGDEGRRMLQALRDWWQSGLNAVDTPRPDTISPIPVGIPLPEAERLARQGEPGDGTRQQTVMEVLDRAIVEMPGGGA